MSERITVSLSIPPAALSPNARVHWGQRARAAAAHREEAFFAARNAIAEPWAGAAWLTIRWCAAGRLPDLDNAAARCKPALDGIVDAGVLVDDDQVRGIRLERGRVDGRPRVELVLHLGDA